MNRSSDKDTNRTIVQAFLKATGILIQEDAICDGEEPLPDVFCTLPDGSRVAFELTEAVVQEVAHNVRVPPAARAQMYGCYQKLPVADQTKLQEIMGNAYISVQAEKNTTDRRFQPVLPKVFALLLRCSSDTQGSLDRNVLPSGIAEIRVTRGRWSTGPFFDRVGLALYVSDPTIERIKAKFSKRYECGCPIELLVHSKTCPLAPDTFWKNEVHDFVQQGIAGSPFCRVSVFDWIDSAIRYTYPQP